MKNETRKCLDYAQENLRSARILMDSDLFLDTIYLPSKYPVGSVLPDYAPDLQICKTCLEIGLRVEKSALKIISGQQSQI